MQQSTLTYSISLKCYSL